MRRAAVALVLLAFATGCAVTSDETVAVIDQDSLDKTLQRVTTTTTSTTLPVKTREVAFFLLREQTEDTGRQVQQISVDVPDSPSIPDLIEPIFRDDFAVDFPDLINRVTEYTLLRVALDDDVATIFLEPREGVEFDDDKFPDIAAQLVWTVTGFGTVDKILIDIAGLVPLVTDDGTTSDPVSTSDYDSYNPEVIADESTTSTTSTTTTTTVAPTTTVDG